MDVIEQFTAAKSGDPSTNEDRIVVTDHHAAVIDGATSKTYLELHNRTLGQVAAQLVGETIQRLAPDVAAGEAVASVTARIRRFYEENGILEKVAAHPTYRASANAIIYSRARHEIWAIGDCHALVDDSYWNYDKRVDQVLAYVRSLVTRLELLEGTSREGVAKRDPGREFILPLLRRQAILQNRNDDPFGFPCFDGFEVPFARVPVLPVGDDVDQIVLASDGYPELLPTLEATETALEGALEEDPLCIGRLMGTKGLKPENDSYDDRTYLRLNVGGPSTPP